MRTNLPATLLIAGLALLFTLSACDRSDQDCIRIITEMDASDVQIVKTVRNGKCFAIFFIPSEQDYQSICHTTYRTEWDPLEEEDAFEMSPGNYVDGLTGSYVRANGKFGGGLAYIVRLEDNKTLVAILASAFYRDRIGGLPTEEAPNAAPDEKTAEPNPFDYPLFGGVAPEPEYNQALIEAIAAKDPAAVKAQVATMSPEDLETNFYIEIAAKDCPPEIVELLIEAHRTPKSSKEAGDVALNNAAIHGNSELARYLLAKGIGNPSWAVSWAAENGDTALTDLLIEAGTSPDVALCAAAMHGQSDLVLHLLDTKGADANAVDETLKTTVLSLALQADPANKTAPFWEDKIKTVKILLQHGANPNNGKSLVELCSSWPWVAPEARLEALNLLLGAGAEALGKDKEGRTPREILASQRDTETENTATYDKAMEILRAAEEKAGK